MQKNRKKTMTSILAIVLVAVLAIGGTLAFLTQQTEKRVNNFTFAAGSPPALDCMLTEPNWDGVVDYHYVDGTVSPIYDYIDDQPVYGYIGNDPSSPITKKAPNPTDAYKPVRPYEDGKNPRTNDLYGDEAAILMTHGSEALKNPFISNRGQLNAWVAAKMSFVYSTGPNAGKLLSEQDLATVLSVVEIDYNTTDWEIVQNDDVSLIFYYKSILSRRVRDADPGVYTKTQPIFTMVSVKATADDEDFWILENMGGFTIFVEGYAAESAVAADYPAFKTWGTAGNVIFENTPTATIPGDISQPGGVVGKGEVVNTSAPESAPESATE